MKAMRATQSDAAGYLLLTRDVGLHYYLPPVETPLTPAPWLYPARETETPFTQQFLPRSTRVTPHRRKCPSNARLQPPAARNVRIEHDTRVESAPTVGCEPLL